MSLMGQEQEELFEFEDFLLPVTRGQVRITTPAGSRCGRVYLGYFAVSEKDLKSIVEELFGHGSATLKEWQDRAHLIRERCCLLKKASAGRNKRIDSSLSVEDVFASKKPCIAPVPQGILCVSEPPTSPLSVVSETRCLDARPATPFFDFDPKYGCVELNSAISAEDAELAYELLSFRPW